MLQVQLERLVGRNIQLIPAADVTTHFLFERDGFVALVERSGDGIGNIGAPGLLSSPSGYAALVWRGGEPWFISKGFEQLATPEQVAGIRSFAADLAYALEQ